VGEAATICIAAMQKDRRGRTRTNEPAVVHRSSFVVEDDGRGLDSFVPVPEYKGTAELKINEEGVPINPMEGISKFLEMEGRGGMEMNSRSPPPPMEIDAPLPSQRQGSKRAHSLSVSSHPRVPNNTMGRDRGRGVE
jgi:hypothetical protein